jgi:hypothetical protein
MEIGLHAEGGEPGQALEIKPPLCLLGSALPRDRRHLCADLRV